ncbi:MAG: DUF433 domain-containing protein [Fimbriimonadaceae bacterium]
MMSAIPIELEDVLVSTPDTLHGGIRFAGTRVFAFQLFDYILNGHTLEEFLADFEGVSREHATALINWELKRVREQLSQAS